MTTLVAPGIDAASLPPGATGPNTAVSTPAPTTSNYAVNANGIVQNTPPPPAPVVTPTPAPTPKPTTAISSDQGAQYAAENTKTLQTLKDTGLTVGQDGLARYSDSSFATAPSDAVQGEDGTWQSGGVRYALGPATTADPEQAKITDQIAAMKTQFDSTSRAMIDNIAQQYNDLISQQSDVNARGEASLGQSLLMAGSSRYAPVSSTGQVTSLMSYGLKQIADLHTKEQSAILQAQQAQDSGDMKLMDEALTQAQNARDEKQKAAQALSEKLVKTNQDLQTQKKSAALSSSIATLMSQGTTDPAKILAALQKNGDVTTTAADVAAAVKDLTPPKSEGDFKFSQAQASQMYAAGLTPADVAALNSYYSGHGDPNLFSSLTPEHQQAVLDALNGTAAKKAASTVPSYAALHPHASQPRVSSYKSGSLTYAPSDVQYGHDQLSQSAQSGPNADGRYANPELYLQMAQAWQKGGGYIKDYVKNYPVSTWINPTNTSVGPAIDAMIRQDAAAASTAKPKSSSTPGGRSL